jgi:hypothetical protein
VELTLSLPGGMWQRIRDVRSRVSEAAAHLSPELRAAAVMVTGELVENAVKYGVCLPDLDDVVLRVSIGEAAVSIEVSSGAASQEAIDEVAARIRRIQSTADRESLYVARLEELLRTPGASGGLGLYRIGFEGRFELSCENVGRVLTVRATRVFP